uniref:SR-related CTD associated factor 1 transcript variant 11 n=1 Tax=Homo sapiens TaxID=9606 RepID=A0A2U8BR29_HUMAN|nr:SR-related CTD associated factor 1 transcript variant 11 [Homo sapiens]
MEEEDESRGKTEESGEDRGDGPPDRDPTLSPSAFILMALGVMAFDGGAAGVHGQSPVPRNQGALTRLLSEDMLELVAEVRIGDRDPIPLPVPSLLPRLRAWRTGKTVTALLFKMEEANLASRAKAQELIQATNQILSHRKPPSSLGMTPAPVPTSLGLPPGPSSYLLPGSLPLGGCGSTPPTPTGLAATSDKREGSSSSEGRGDTDKYLKKLHTQERAVEEVKLAIKPYYQKKDITKEEYKDILRKAVHKICHSKSGEINPVKVSNLVRAYVQRYRYFRKHGRKPGDPPGPPRPPKEPGPPDKGGPGLPLPPL